VQQPVRRRAEPIDTGWLEKQPPEVPTCTEPYLGWDDDGMRFGTREDSVGIVGPPRYGKTSGLIIPACMTWAGALVCTSTRSDILRATVRRRTDLTASHGGGIHVYDPFSSEFPPDQSLHWSPTAGCEDSSVCYRRVQAMTSVAGRGVEDASHWQSGAAQVLRAYFHAAALEGLPLARVREWLGSQAVEEPAAIIRGTEGAASMWAADLEAIANLGDRERGSFYQVARNTLEATAEPRVLASCSRSDLEIDHFLRSRSSLFIIGPSHYQQAIAPLVAGLLDAIAQRAAELAGVEGGRLDPPLLLALDEVANIAPVQSLPALVSEGGGRGILTIWAVQSLAQLRARYGEEQSEAIIAATSAKLIFGGLSNARDLENISGWAGQKRHNTSFAELPVKDIQQLPVLKAWLFYRSDPPRLMDVRPAYTVPVLADAMGTA
jgi:type IV secretion system protein VirD4